MSENQNESKHYGVLGMKWGVRRYENKDGTLTEAGKKRHANTGESMKSSAAIAKEPGSDKKAGIDAKARFMIEYDPKTNNGGTTHSYVYVPTQDGIIWVENAWGGHAGIKKFSTVSEIEKMYRTARSSGEWGNSKKYSRVEFQDFKLKDHEYGETLEELVNKTLK